MTNDKASIREVYEISQRLEGKLDTALDKMDERLMKVEGEQSRAKGFAAAIGAVTGAGITLLGAFIQGGLHK